jgi:hypothetical protein
VLAACGLQAQELKHQLAELQTQHKAEHKQIKVGNSKLSGRRSCLAVSTPLHTCRLQCEFPSYIESIGKFKVNRGVLALDLPHTARCALLSLPTCLPPIAVQELKAAAEQAQRSMLPLAEHRQLLQQAQEAAAAAARMQEAEHIAQVSCTVRGHGWHAATSAMSTLHAFLCRTKGGVANAGSDKSPFMQDATSMQHAY